MIKISYKHSRAFTLIELLVVISIIGLLSSVVLASLSGTRERSGVAAGQTFDTHTYSAWNDDLVLSWEFDSHDGSNNIIDQTGNGNNLFLVNPGIITNTTNPFKIGKVISVSGDSGKTASSPSLIIGGPTNIYSVSFWINTTGTNSIEYLSNLFINTIPGRWRFYMDSSSNLVFTTVSSSGVVLSPPLPSFPIKINQWYHVMAVCDNNKVAMYINGKQVTNFSSFTDGVCHYNSNNLYILGSSLVGGPTNRYYLDNIRVYKKAFTVSQAREIYLAEKEGMYKVAMIKK